jgi:FkbM family methyltransferase
LILTTLASKTENPQINIPPEEFSTYEKSLGGRAAILNSANDSWVFVQLNGMNGYYPVSTLKTMIHCLWVEGDAIVVRVETAHITKMMVWLDEYPRESMYIDVGAATGAACIPIAQKFGSDLEIIAFEPAFTASSLLLATLEKNGIDCVRVVKKVVSNNVGEVEFLEYGADPTGATPWLPEASSIFYQGIDTINSVLNRVDSIRLDSLLESNMNLMNLKRIVIKIDVEGFEIEVLEGSTSFINQLRPFFSIDIHKTPQGTGTTEKFCREFLEKYSYSFEIMGHVLLATPE